jgi:hypothetical protein
MERWPCDKADKIKKQNIRKRGRESKGSVRVQKYLFELQNWYLWQGICGIKRNC